MISSKTKILATVPIAMIFEFMLLESFLSANQGNSKINVSQETFSFTNDEFTTSDTQKSHQAMPKFFKSKNKIKVLSFPEPAKHTFIGREESHENFTLNGAIIK